LNAFSSQQYTLLGLLLLSDVLYGIFTTRAVARMVAISRAGNENDLYDAVLVGRGILAARNDYSNEAQSHS
jgi:hypothetical protein